MGVKSLYEAPVSDYQLAERIAKKLEKHDKSLFTQFELTYLKELIERQL